MATPNYRGEDQPPPNGGGWLGSWLGGTPAYKSVTKKAATSAAQAAPADAQMCVEQSDACGARPIAIVIPREVIEQQ
ncbi:MAG: hypothetical protein JO257_15185 [Deltaproteobacteria bacterium]|nr:hypothetical protein [Deltaproteobacteria bacterium]